jgi:putative aldouronate transport system permease protein
MKKSRLLKKMYNASSLYLLLLPVILYFAIFHYVPIYGITLAFKDFKFSNGILGSPWVGFANFQKLFSSVFFYRVLTNTLVISIYRLIFGFPAPIILAILLNEMTSLKFKRIVQTVSYLPHFISWVILAGIVTELLSPSRGVINYILSFFGREPIYFLASAEYFRPILIISGIWQSVGWGSIIYLAAIAGIDEEQKEAAYIDGANRFQIIRYIIIPSIIPVISIVLILNLGSILNAGFDQVFNLYNAMVMETGDIIDTYVYRVGLVNMQYSFSTAVGLFKNLIGFFLVISANMVIRRFDEGKNAIW